MKKILTLICTLLCANVLMAQTRFWVGDLQYEITGTYPHTVMVYDANTTITTANIPATVTVPATVTFAGTTCSVTSIGYKAFYACSSLTSVTIGNSVASIGDWAFSYCSSLTSVTIPNSVTAIGTAAFQSCSSLTSITIPNSVTEIGACTFASCSSLTSVTIPNSVIHIEYSAFSGCSSLTSVTIGNSVTSIEYSAFQSCSSLTSVTIGNSVTFIGYDAFSNCSSLTSVTCLSETAPTLEWTNFLNTPNEKNLIVPCGALDNYINSYWNDCFANIIEEIDFTITANVNNSAFGSVAVESDCSTSTATLTATANEGYKFVRWNDGNTENPRIVTLSSDITFTAIFSEINNSSLMDVEHSELSLYPNPTNSKVTFNQAIEKVEVIDLSGKTLQTYENANEINIETLPAGVYHLRLTIKDKIYIR